MVWVSLLQIQLVSSEVWYPHLLRSALQQPQPVLSLFRHFHSLQLHGAPEGRSSWTLIDIVVLVGRLAAFSVQRASLVAGTLASGRTVWRKLLLDFSLGVAGMWPNSGCLSSVAWRWRSFLLAAVLRMSGGAIPLRMKRLSGGVGLRHPVMSLQVALRAVLTRLAWGDLSQTGQAYSAAE